MREKGREKRMNTHPLVASPQVAPANMDGDRGTLGGGHFGSGEAESWSITWESERCMLYVGEVGDGKL
jgi:hypothetical protein